MQILNFAGAAELADDPNFHALLFLEQDDLPGDTRDPLDLLIEAEDARDAGDDYEWLD